MTEATILALILGGVMAWRGYRRGALASFLGWLPPIAGIAVLGAALRFAWDAPGYLPFLGCAGVLGGLAAYGAVRALTRPRRRELLCRRAEPARPHGWQVLSDRLAGAVLGLIHSSVLCLTGSLILSMIVFVAASREETAPSPGAAPEASPLLGWLRRSSGRLAEVATRTTLNHVPPLDVYGAEVKALIAVLNASPEEQNRILRALDLELLVGLPAVAQAVRDEEYCALLERVKNGDLTAIYTIARHPHTERLMECPEIRALAGRLTPSELVRLMARGAE